MEYVNVFLSFVSAHYVNYFLPRYFVLEYFSSMLRQYYKSVEESLQVIPADIDALRQLVDGVVFPRQ